MQILSSPSNCPTIDHIKSLLNGSGSSLPTQPTHKIIIESFNTSAADADAMPYAPTANIDLPTMASNELPVTLDDNEWEQIIMAAAEADEAVNADTLSASTNASMDESVRPDIDRQLKELENELADAELLAELEADYLAEQALVSPPPPPPTSAPPPAIQAQNTKGFLSSMLGNLFSSCRNSGGKRQTKKRKQKKTKKRKKIKRKKRYSKSYKHVVKHTIKKKTKRRKNKTKKKI